MPIFEARDGTRLHYRDTAAAAADAPVVLALAGLTRTQGDFDYVAPHMTHCRLVRMDYRGRGNSAWADPASYTILQEANDALDLLDHLGIPAAAILGTSRGGLIAMTLAALAKDRLTGVCLNDIGPDIAPAGFDAIRGYLGRRPAARTHCEAAQMRAGLMAGFANVPDSRWVEEVHLHYRQTADGLDITYDPALRQAVLDPLDDPDRPDIDLWPLFDAFAGLPLALIRGANSDLLTRDTAAEMARRRSDMIWAEVPDRGHVPFLDEAEALEALHTWIAKLP